MDTTITSVFCLLPLWGCPLSQRMNDDPWTSAGHMSNRRYLPSSTYLLKTQLFNFLGNMGYMSVKD